jgi:SAM-dependent methyltransferase
MSLTPDAIAFVRAALPPAPARVLEIGAGDGQLATLLAASGYDVLAIDPSAQAEHVVPVSLLDVRADDASFDAAVAMLSLHHVEPLPQSCRRLAGLVRSGGRLVLDEFDVERLDAAAAGWWIAQRAATGCEHPHDAAAMVTELQRELHPVRTLRAELAPFFELSEPVRGPYLHRWKLEPGLRDAEELLIAAGHLPAAGARLVGTRRA